MVDSVEELTQTYIGVDICTHTCLHMHYKFTIFFDHGQGGELNCDVLSAQSYVPF